MHKELLKKIIIENQEFIRKVEVQPRQLHLEKAANLVFVGPRRAGKTFAMFHLIKNMFTAGVPPTVVLYINFEDERLLEMTSRDLDLILDAWRELFEQKPVIFLDEIQVIDGWEKFARRLADNKYRVFITGSNASMLSSEIATTLGGRFMIQEIFPLTFAEYLQMKNITPESNWQYSEQRFEIKKQFQDYFYFGGFPEIVQFNNKRLWLNNLYQKIFFGDLIARYNIRNDFAMRLMVKKLAESIHDEISFNRIRHIIQSTGVKIGTATIIDYAHYLSETWLIFDIKNYYAKITERESSGKYYFIDNGILALFLMNPETILLENSIACHLRRRYGKEIFFAKRNTEVDFYIPSANLLIQVAYQIDTEATIQREINALVKAATELKANNLLIITLDDEKTIESNGYNIAIIPVWKWLLENES